jgi:hypothetical protein
MKKCAERRVAGASDAAVYFGAGRTSLAWLKQALDLPASAAWLGFGIQRRGEDSFLSGPRPDADCHSIAWVDTPEGALSFGVWGEVIQLCDACPGTIVVLMFDVGDEILVFPAR